MAPEKAQNTNSNEETSENDQQHSNVFTNDGGSVAGSPKIVVGSLLAPNGDAVRADLVKTVSIKSGIPLVFQAGYDEGLRSLTDEKQPAIAFLCGALYTILVGQGHVLSPLVAPVSIGSNAAEYHSELIVSSQSGFEKLDDLKGATFVANGKDSLSGYISMSHVLSETGRAEFFGRVVISGSHQESIQQVIHGGGDVAAIDCEVLHQALKVSPALSERIRRIGKLHSYPAPLISSSGLRPQEEARLRQAFVELGNTAEGEKALKQAAIDRFVAVSDSTYDIVRQTIAQVENFPLGVVDRPPHPFLNDKHTADDTKVLEYLFDHIKQTLSHKKDRGQLFVEEENGRYHRIILNDPSRLLEATKDERDLTFVGFFGLRRPGSSDNVLNDADEQLTTEEFERSPNLGSYSTYQLPDGRYGNLVLFSDPKGLEDWQAGSLHQKVVRLYSHTHYDAIRIHRGIIYGGLGTQTKFKVQSTKKFDMGLTFQPQN